MTRRFYLHMVDLGVVRTGGSDDDEGPADPDSQCSAGGVEGTCMDVDDCPSPTYVTTAGLCPGPAAIQCCTPVTCASGGRRGECRNVSSCEPATHETVAGLCPGPSTIRCCLPL